MNEGTTAGIVPISRELAFIVAPRPRFSCCGVAARWFRSGWGCITLQSAKLCASEVFIGGGNRRLESKATPVESSFHDASSHGREKERLDVQEIFEDGIIFPRQNLIINSPPEEKRVARLLTVVPFRVGRGV